MRLHMLGRQLAHILIGPVMMIEEIVLIGDGRVKTVSVWRYIVHLHAQRLAGNSDSLAFQFGLVDVAAVCLELLLVSRAVGGCFCVLALLQAATAAGRLQGTARRREWAWTGR